jgi:chemotaxis signal transduction protein
MTGVQALLVPVGADLYALPVDWVCEVVAAPTVTPLATAPAVVLGLFNLRGQIVPLLDTAALLGIGTVETIAFTVVVSSPHGPVGLAASGFPQRAVLDASIGPSELPGTTGLYQVDQRVAACLDPAALLTPERIGGYASRSELAAAGVD